jgi:abortive infection bacteriophage resistance protein
VGGLGRRYQIQLAQHFGVLRGVDFVSWMRAMTHLRNICAHHDRLWNRELVDHPVQPQGPEEVFFGSLLGQPAVWQRTYAALCVVAYLDRQISGTGAWSAAMAAHLSGLPTAPGIAYDGLGAPDDWNEHLAWEGYASGPDLG